MSVTLWISSSDSYSERRLGLDLTISDLKNKLELITGISFHHQILSLQRTHIQAGHGGHGEGPGQKETIKLLNDNNLTLEQYNLKDWMTIRVDSSDPFAKSTAGQFTDTSNLERFELTKEEYESRSDTVLAYKQRNKLGRFAPPPPSLSPNSSSTLPKKIPFPKEIQIGLRCQVKLSEEEGLDRRGIVRFIGVTEFGGKKKKLGGGGGEEGEEDGEVDADDIWIGVECDEPLGKGDGMVEGKRYFQTLPKRAIFTKFDKIIIGDFPEIDPFDEDDMEGLDEM